VTYAAETTVTVGRSQEEIVKTLMRYRVDQYSFGAGRTSAMVEFLISGYPVRIAVPVPARPEHPKMKSPTTGRMVDAEKAWDQVVRQRWRALLLLIKANLEAVEMNLLTVDQAFMAYLVTGDGKVLGDTVLPQYGRALKQLEA
jgi:hypothetical protein